MSQALPDNGLFLSPKEINTEVNKSTKVNNGGFNWGQNYFTDRVREGVSIDPDTGNVNRDGFAYWMQWAGQNEDAVRKLGEANTSVKESREIKGMVEGVNREYLDDALGDRKLTRGNVAEVVKKANKTDFQALTPAQEAEKTSRVTRDGLAVTAQQDATRVAERSLTHQIESGKAAATRAEKQFNYLEAKESNRFALQNAQRLDDKAEQRRERLDLLDRQDHRYAQEMQRYDKRRQTETIQGLIGGLASLGAAFAM